MKKRYLLWVSGVLSGNLCELVRMLTILPTGVDSLVTIELRGWLRRRLGIEVTTLEILSTNGGTIASLGQIAVERLKSKFGVSTENGLDACATEKSGSLVTV